MTSPPPVEQPPAEELRRVLADLLPGNERAVPDSLGYVALDVLGAAGALVVKRQAEAESLSPLGGYVVATMRANGLSWRQIYDRTGIVQRTAGRWMNLYLKHGLSPDPRKPDTNETDIPS